MDSSPAQAFVETNVDVGLAHVTVILEDFIFED